MIALKEKRCEDCIFSTDYSYNLLLCQFHDDLVCKGDICFMWAQSSKK